LKGTIPTQLGLLTNLGELRLGFNSHIGEIPSEIGNLGEHLVFLDIEGNSLEGEIPPQLGGLDKLTKLHLSRNDLSGTIPSALGQLKNLGMKYSCWCACMLLENETHTHTLTHSLCLLPSVQLN